MHAQIVLFDGFDPLDALAPFEVLWAAGLRSGGLVTVELVTAEGPREVIAGCGGLSLRATATLDPTRPGVIVVPGAAGPLGPTPTEAADAIGTIAADDPDSDAADDPPEPGDDSIPVLLARTLDTPLPGLLAAALAHDDDVVVATVCGGALVLAMAGLIEGRHAVTHHLGMDLLDATGTCAVDARVVDDGNLVSAGAVTSGLDLGLYLVERFVGPRIARAVEQLFAYERRGVVWYADGPEPVAV